MNKKIQIVFVFTLIFCLYLNNISAVITREQLTNKYTTINKLITDTRLGQLDKYIQENTTSNKIESTNVTLNSSDNVDKTLEKHGGLISNNLTFRNNIKRTMLSATQYDISYDPRPLNKMTPVKDQGYNDTCWAFASLRNARIFYENKKYRS